MTTECSKITDIIEAIEATFWKQSVKCITSSLTQEIEEREEFIQTVEEYLFKDWDMTPKSMYKLASFFSGKCEFEDIAKSLLCEAAKAKHPTAMAKVAWLCRMDNIPKSAVDADALLDEAYISAKQLPSPQEKLEAAKDFASFALTSSELARAEVLAEEALALGAEDNDHVISFISHAARWLKEEDKVA